MIGIVLISHGDFAKGLAHTAALFFGNLDNFDYLCLQAKDNPEDFRLLLEKKIKSVDDGDGVIVLGDLIGGSPLNQAAYLLNDRVKVIGGMNLPLLIELLSTRMSSNISLDHIIEAGKSSIQSLNELMGV